MTNTEPFEARFGSYNKDWPLLPLPDVVFFQEGPGLRSWQWTDEGMKVINVKNILLDGRLSPSNTDKFISLEEFEAKYPHFAIDEGDIVVSSSGWSYGKVARVNRDHLPLMMNTSVIRFRPLSVETLNVDYLYHFLRSDFFQNQVESFIIGVQQPNFGPIHIKRMVIPLPPFTAQQKIASILSAYDDLIENNLRRIKILEEMAQNLYREWFVRFRFPGHEKNKLIKSELGMIPKGWEVKTLGENISFTRGKNITKKKIISGNVPVVAAGIDPAYYHNESNVKSPVVTISASGANAGFIRLYYEDIWASDCSYVNRDTTTNIYYYYSLLKSRQEEISALQRGSAQPHVYPKDIVRLLMVGAPEKLIIEFEEISKSLFNGIGNLKLRNINLCKTRDLLLPKLISGKLDVSELDIEIRKDEQRCQIDRP